MRPFLKFLSLVLLISIVLGLSEKWYNMFFLGRYWEHASILATCLVGFIIPAGVAYLSFIGIQKVINLKNQ